MAIAADGVIEIVRSGSTRADERDHPALRPHPLGPGRLVWTDESHLLVSPAHAGHALLVDAATGLVTEHFSRTFGALAVVDPTRGTIASVPTRWATGGLTVLVHDGRDG